jgi:hypothetical protein
MFSFTTTAYLGSCSVTIQRTMETASIIDLFYHDEPATMRIQSGHTLHGNNLKSMQAFAKFFH